MHNRPCTNVQIGQCNVQFDKRGSPAKLTTKLQSRHPYLTTQSISSCLTLLAFFQQLMGLRIPFSGTWLFPHTAGSLPTQIPLHQGYHSGSQMELAALAPNPLVSQFHTGSNPKFSDAVKELSTVKARQVELIRTTYRTGPNSTIYHLEVLEYKVFSLNSIDFGSLILWKEHFQVYL